ncbi:hypothetical protein [Streptomyces sp. NBC_01244]|nr:hypothetical protein OG247_02535 [Streptomyces sp. NBC_01244]
MRDPGPKSLVGVVDAVVLGRPEGAIALQALLARIAGQAPA